MKLRLFAILFSATMLGCSSATPSQKSSNSKAEPSQQQNRSVKLLQSVTPGYKETFPQGSKVKIGYKEAEKVDSVVITVDGKKLNSDTYTSPTNKVGKISYNVKAYKGEQSQTLNGEFTVVAATAPRMRKIQIVRKYPHDKNAYTQGLLFNNGKLYESTGQYGKSTLRITNIEDGKVLKEHKLDDKYFGEGLVLLNGKLYQLTWEQGTVLVYDVDDFGKVSTFPISGEGWGICTDGKYLYANDGNTYHIAKYDPETFSKISQFEVADNTKRIKYINEMEWIDGKIWANIYTTNLVAIINPQSGVVESYIDCSALEKAIGNKSTADVLNGIAHDSSTGRLWMTGKDWDTLFEVKVVD